MPPVTETASETTRWLIEWSRGDPEALAQVMPRVYGELRRIAAGYLRRERPDHTLETSALVHEAYLRLVDQSQVSWHNRAHFLAIAAQSMRRILVDHARQRTYAKRGGNAASLTLDEVMTVSLDRPADLVALDDALEDLAQFDPDKAKLVELRYFGGLDVHEIAAALDISVATVTRRWRLAKAWLYQQLVQGGGDRP